MRIELTIQSNYLPSWGAYEGIRELLQNGKDAETEHHAALEVRHDADRCILIIENTGCTLSHNALLFGNTSKAGRNELIGKFGEGLKIGCLALARAGHGVKIRSGSEVWVPTIERSKKFDAEVLVMYIESGNAEKQRVQVEVQGVNAEAWELLKAKFLFLTPAKDFVETSYGNLLLPPEYVGKIYVKGIFVETDMKFHHGYDLTQGVEVDRDRRMIARWELEWRTRMIWAEAAPSRRDVLLRFFECIDADAADVSGINTGTAGSLPQEIKEHALTAFQARHGVDAIPVDTLAESKDIEHYGKVGIITNRPLTAILRASLGTAAEVKEKLQNEVIKTWAWHELDETERFNLEDAIALINPVAPVSLNDIDVVTYLSPTIMGSFMAGRIQVAQNRLNSRETTLETLVHEVAHHSAGDGEHRHISELERIWSGIVLSLRGEQWKH